MQISIKVHAQSDQRLFLGGGGGGEGLLWLGLSLTVNIEGADKP